MVSSSDLIRMIASKLQEYKAANIVVDPVMVATSGAKLISDDAIETLKKELLPLATVITPNIPEAEVLADMKIANEEEMIIAAEKISKKFGCAILVKGGHQINDAMICCIEMTHIHGFMENVLTTLIHMEQDVHYPVLSHPILQRDMIWIHP